MRMCTECSSDPKRWSRQTAPPGRCGECGRAFDLQGNPILDEGVTCPVHEPILASCPHTGADATAAPAPEPSWLAGPAG